MCSRLDPSIPGAFVGRARESESLDSLFAEGARLVTIAGVAGVGKTRLAVEWARRASRRAGLVEPIVCELADARDLDEACAVIARALAAPLAASATAEQAIDQLGKALAAAGERVVVLDNLEQLVDASPGLLSPLSALAPAARLVVTSRERLRLAGEVCLSLDPLAVPPADAPTFEEISASDAVRLFVARARAVRFDFELGPDDAGAVAAIVQSLDGIPLAIELCAARIGVLSPAQILARMSRRFDLLAAGSRGAPARQATLRGAIDWSWELLESEEQEALAQCSVFRGGFSIEAAEGVLDLGAAEGARPTFDVVQALSDQSLLRAFDVPGSPSERRYRLLETIRAYAEERLEERGGREAAITRHAAFFLARSDRRGAVLGADDVRRASLDADNLVAVATRALERGPLTADAADAALRALLLLEPVLLVCARGRLAPYVAMLDAALAGPSFEEAEAPANGGVRPDVLRARAHYTRGLADLLRGRVVDGIACFERARVAARQASSPGDEARALTKIALLLDLADRQDDARERFDEARRIVGELGDDALAGDWALAYAGALLWRGRSAEALRYAEQALASLREAGDLRGHSIACAQLAQASLSLGRYDDAARLAERTRALLEATGDRRTEAFVLAILGRVDQARGRFEDARDKLAQAIVIHHGVGDRLSAGIACGYLGDVAWESGERDRARASYLEALGLLRGSGERHYVVVFAAALRALDAETGGAIPEPGLAAGADAALSTRVAVHLYAGFGDVARARRAASDGDAANAERHRRTAVARRAIALSPAVDGAPAAVDAAEDVRLALRLLERALAAPIGPGSIWKTADSQLASAPQMIVVGPDARWLRVGDGEPAHLLKGRAARLMLGRLVRARLDAPGRALTRAELFAAGWPGERIAERAAANRVHVTLTKLRKLGLAGFLQSRDDGFLLDAAAVVVEAIAGERASSVAAETCD